MTYLFPNANGTDLGIVSAGTNVTITDGVISATGGSSIVVGTWTPTLITNGSGTIELIVRNAHYSKIGQQVICMFDITVKNITGGRGSDTVSLGGLPSISITDTGYVGSVSIPYFNKLAILSYYVAGSVLSNSTIASLWHNPFIDIIDSKSPVVPLNASVTSLQQNDLQNDSELSGTVIYLCAI